MAGARQPLRIRSTAAIGDTGGMVSGDGVYTGGRSRDNDGERLLRLPVRELDPRPNLYDKYFELANLRVAGKGLNKATIEVSRFR